MTETLTSSLLCNLGEKWHEAQVEPIDSVRAPLTKCWKSFLSDIFQFALKWYFSGGGAESVKAVVFIPVQTSDQRRCKNLQTGIPIWPTFSFV